MSWIAAKEGEDGVVTLPPVRSVDFMVGIDFGAVIKTVAVAGERVN